MYLSGQVEKYLMPNVSQVIDNSLLFFRKALDAKTCLIFFQREQSHFLEHFEDVSGNSNSMRTEPGLN